MSKNSNHEAHMFFVDSRFQRLARRPGGVSREQAMKNAQAKIDESKPEFDAWLDQELQALVDLIQKVEAGAADPGWRDVVCAHSVQLRDIGTTMGFTLLTFIATNLCEILEGTNGNECNTELITCHVDALLLSRQQQYRNLRPDQLPELSGGLRRVAESAKINRDGPPK